MFVNRERERELWIIGVVFIFGYVFFVCFKCEGKVNGWIKMWWIWFFVINDIFL